MQKLILLYYLLLLPLSPPEVLKLPIIAQLQKASPWNVPLSGVKGGGGSGGGSVVRVGSGRSPFISRLQTPQSGMTHFAQVRHLTMCGASQRAYCRLLETCILLLQC